MRPLPLLLSLLPACGYTWGAAATQARTAGGALPSVALLPFDNGTFYRGLEQDLTRLVGEELRARSPGAPSDPSRADWTITGRIVRAEQRVYSEDRDDEVRESSFTATVEVVVRNRATGETIHSYSLTEREPFSERAGRTATLEQAQELVLKDLAEGVVYGLEERIPKRDQEETQ